MFRIGLILVITHLISACTASDPSSDLIAAAQKKVDISKSPSTGVGRDPSDIQLSNRQYTYVDLDPTQLGNNGPWFLDLDIEFDSANIWLQSDLDCEGCDPQQKQEREQQWDLKIDGRKISLNTNRVDPDNDATYQAVAATNIYQPLESFNESITLDTITFKPQTASIEPQLQGDQLIKGAASFGASFLLRTTAGDRYIYLQLVEANEVASWVLFHVREQVIGRDESFKPVRKLYLRWGEDAIGNQGIMNVDDNGILSAYFDFDACYSDANSSSCFSDEVQSGVGHDVVNTNKIDNYDLYFRIRIGTWDQASMILNGAGARDNEFNNQFDAAGLYLGKNDWGKLSYDKSLSELWGFNSMNEFRRIADASDFDMKNFGSDGFNTFDKNIWYDVVREPAGNSTAQANQRIYLFETTEKEGLALQISKTDIKGNIRQIAYQGPKVKQRRQFDIRFRQPETVNIEMLLHNEDLAVMDADGNPTTLREVPVFALDQEIVDAETGLPLAKDEYDLINFSIRVIKYRTDEFISGVDPIEWPSYTIDPRRAALMVRQSQGSETETSATNYATSAGEYQNVSIGYIPTLARRSCERYEQEPDKHWNAYQINARLPGKELISWRVNYRTCRYFNE